MSAFVVDGRLTAIPTTRAKRMVVLDWLAQDFEPGRRYSEKMVNLDPRQAAPRHRRAASLPRRRGAAGEGGGGVLEDRRHDPAGLR